MAVAAGFAAMVVFVLVVFPSAHVWMGTERVLCPGGYEASVAWTIVATILGILAALVGGAVCGRIAAGPAPVWWLAGLTFVLGLGYATLRLLLEDPGARASEVHLLEAQFLVQSPTWWLFLMPGLDLVGIAAAGLWARPRSSPLQRAPDSPSNPR